MATLARIPVSEIQPHTQVSQTFRVLDKQHRANRQGNMYLLMQLSDRTGVISAMRWNSDQRLYDSFQKGDYINIDGAAQLHNGNMQIIVNDLEWVDQSKVNLKDFENNDPAKIEDNWNSLRRSLDSIEDPDLKAIGNAIFDIPYISERYKLAPAGIKTHHAFPGGLVVHVLQLIKLSEFVATLYPNINRDILLVGVLLHDIGKIEELLFDGELGYSDSGQLLGHLVQGVAILDNLIDHVEAETKQTIDPEAILRLKHIIVSHHGLLEHGSPKVPMTLEAIAFAQLDDMDAKLNAAMETMRADRNTDSPWTNYHPTLGRKLYKPSDQE